MGGCGSGCGVGVGGFSFVLGLSVVELKLPLGVMGEKFPEQF